MPHEAEGTRQLVHDRNLTQRIRDSWHMKAEGSRQLAHEAEGTKYSVHETEGTRQLAH